MIKKIVWVSLCCFCGISSISYAAEKDKNPNNTTTTRPAPTTTKPPINFDNVKIEPNAGTNKKNKNKGGQGDKG